MTVQDQPCRFIWGLFIRVNLPKDNLIIGILQALFAMLLIDFIFGQCLTKIEFLIGFKHKIGFNRAKVRTFPQKFVIEVYFFGWTLQIFKFTINVYS